jgi:hypothetical protein
MFQPQKQMVDLVQGLDAVLFESAAKLLQVRQLLVGIAFDGLPGFGSVVHLKGLLDVVDNELLARGAQLLPVYELDD